MIVIVGAGICGLAAAYELSRRGEDSIVLERGEPFGEQSAGLARIFRIAHRRPELCRLALRARVGWQRWETELGAGRLLGSEGFIAAGAGDEIAAAMKDVGAAYSWLDRPAIEARIPFLVSPWETGVFDPLGGSLRIRRALTRVIAAGRHSARRGQCGRRRRLDDACRRHRAASRPRADLCGGSDAGPLRSAGRRVRPTHPLHLPGRRRDRRRMPVRARGLRVADRQHRPLGLRAGVAGPGGRARRCFRR